MSRLKIEKPSKVKPAPEKSPNKAAFFILLAIAAAIAAVAFYLWARPGKAPSDVLEVSSFTGDVQVFDKLTGKWSPIDRGRKLQIGDRLKTGAEAEVDMEVPEKIRVRVKQNSEFGFMGPKMYEKNPYIRMQLDRGEMLAATQKGFGDERLDIETPHFTAKSQGGYFRVRTSEESKKSWLGLMRGKAKIQTGELFGGKTFEVQGLEVAEAEAGKPISEPRRVSKDEWQELSEVYQLTVKSAALEAEQLDLSKSTGSLFDFVFDHGTFYTPEFGYALREFFKDENTGGVSLEVEYDVFPKGSFVGMYIKTRDLDLSQYSHLEFEMRQVPDEGFPQAIRLEIKSKSGVARAFAAKLPRKDWEKVSFPLHVKESIFSTELALVFLHDRVGEYKKGSVQFRNVNLIKAEKPPVQAVVKQAAEVVPGPKEVIVAVPVPEPVEPEVESIAPPAEKTEEPESSVWAKPITL